MDSIVVGVVGEKQYDSSNLNAVRKGFPRANASYYGLNNWLEFNNTQMYILEQRNRKWMAYLSERYK